MSFTYEQMAKMIDHSLLNPTLTVADLEEFAAALSRSGIPGEDARKPQ